MVEAVSIDMSSVMNSKQKFNQRLITSINKKLDTLQISYTPEDVEKVVALLNEGKTKTQLTEEIVNVFANDKDKINNSFINYLIGYANVCCTPVQAVQAVQETEAATEELKSPSIKSDKASAKAENISKAKRRVSQSSRSRRSIIEGAPLSPPPSPPKSNRTSSISSSDYEKSQKNIYHQKRLSRSANTLDLTSQVQSEVMAQSEILAQNLALNSGVEKERKRSQSIRSHRSSFSSVKEEDTSRIRCQYWPSCNRGDQCKYWHPKELCKKFPNCPYGDKCLYIHPAVTTPSKPHNRRVSQSSNASTKQQSYNRRVSQSSNTTPDLSGERSTIECKYGSNCTRLDCKFSHPSPALAKLNKQGSTSNSTPEKNSKANVPCHYYPNCKNADCPYMHPTPKTAEPVNVACRYGSSCTKKDCRFLHPSSRRI